MKGHTINVSDDVYDYLRGMIDDEHIANGDMSGEVSENGEVAAHRPTFSEVIGYLIEDRETSDPMPASELDRLAKQHTTGGPI